jgi:AcrR family transcriptional regulator
VTGLRERKKARTRADLQRHALRLIREKGWAATTADDIAAAAEVSRSTFFRYFPTKEDVVLYDDVDPLIAEAVLAQPAGTPLLTAFRRGFAAAFAGLDPDKRAHEELRMQLAREIPEIAATARERGAFGVDDIAQTLAAFFGLEPGSPDARIFAGVMVGARMAAHAIVTADPTRSYIDTLDEVFGRLERGIPLADLPLPG